MLGDDVVDLRDPEARPGATHARFDERVFAARELAMLDRSGSREELRWALWAAKESSYKAARKLDRELGFSPRRFEVEVAGEGEASVDCGRLRLAVRWQHRDGAVHAVAVTPDARHGELLQDFARVEQPGADPSAAVRRLAIERLAERLGVSPARLAIERRGRIPVVCGDLRRWTIDLSLSHHGAVIGFAALLVPGGDA